MLKNFILTGLGATLLVCAVYANQTNGKIVLPNPKTSATSGSQMYSSYCAPCHGADAKGRGPVAGSLKSQPADLTVLTRNNHGKFPSAHIVTALDFGVTNPAHGTAEMPVWGPILGNMNKANPQDRVLRISNLSRYLESIQVK